jgi:K+-sensing histidine kinase KdpD
MRPSLAAQGSPLNLARGTCAAPNPRATRYRAKVDKVSKKWSHARSSSLKEKQTMNQEVHLSDFLFRIALTALAVVLSIGAEFVLETMQASAPYLVFLPAIIGACALGGFAMAMCAIVFSAFGLLFFFIPPNGFALPNAADFVHLCIFIAVAAFGCWIIDGLRRSNHELTRDNVVLGCKITSLLQQRRIR